MKKAGWILLALACCLGACAPNNVKIEHDWEKYFTKNKAEGCFMLFDNSQGQFQAYNMDRIRLRFPPSGTFDILNTLIALQTGKIPHTSTVIPDSVTGQNLSTDQAFKVGDDAHFREMARLIGRQNMAAWMDSVKYGNMKIDSIDRFWLDNTLLISADEQLGFAKKLYFDNLPFTKTSMEEVRKMMLQENTSKYTLSYKISAGKMGKKNVGWVVGWIEENRHPTFFVLNIESEDPAFDMKKIQLQTTRDILLAAGYFKGEK
ncbi:class D beta-lactamase [Chitinophaga costaii]|nr:penicillin-binding transpeptidase domain-containing protein [Chitinophaga costaii]PUZ26490.1 class D beta-lactamase [Chitinophaga costaii]